MVGSFVGCVELPYRETQHYNVGNTEMKLTVSTRFKASGKVWNQNE
jgi:hypothetical protein